MARLNVPRLFEIMGAILGGILVRHLPGGFPEGYFEKGFFYADLLIFIAGVAIFYPIYPLLKRLEKNPLFYSLLYGFLWAVILAVVLDAMGVAPISGILVLILWMASFLFILSLKRIKVL